MARKQKGSQPCALKSCGRRVAFDNPDRPYCNYHKSLKNAQSRVTSPESGMTIEEQRNFLYAPKGKSISRSSMTADVMINGVGSKMSASVVLPSFNAWRKSTRGLDMSDPQVSRDNRDKIIDNVRKTLEKTGKVTTRTLLCKSGFTIGADGESLPLEDHRVILVNDTATGDNIIVDVATTAPMVGHEEELTSIDSGVSTLKDNFFVAYMYEFAEYSSSEYKNIIDEETGDTVWENNNVDMSDTPESRAAREALKKYGHPNPEGITTQTLEPEQPVIPERRSDEDLTLDEMISGFYDNDGSR